MSTTTIAVLSFVAGVFACQVFNWWLMGIRIFGKSK